MGGYESGKQKIVGSGGGVGGEGKGGDEWSPERGSTGERGEEDGFDLHDIEEGEERGGAGGVGSPEEERGRGDGPMGHGVGSRGKGGGEREGELPALPKPPAWVTEARMGGTGGGGGGGGSERGVDKPNEKREELLEMSNRHNVKVTMPPSVLFFPPLLLWFVA